jgi:hypothetical protein
VLIEGDIGCLPPFANCGRSSAPFVPGVVTVACLPSENRFALFGIMLEITMILDRVDPKS